MPLIRHSEGASYYRQDGADDRPVLVLTHALGQDHGMWDAQVQDLLPHFRVIRYDIRGHGGSEAPRGDYTIEQLGREALALADALGLERFGFCGLSLGGMIGQWLASNAPHRLTHLVLANTSARIADPAGMETRRRDVLDRGMAAVVDTVMSRLFSPSLLAANPPAVATARRTLLATDPIGYAGCCAAIRDLNHTSVLSQIRVPTLVISGDLDVAMPWQDHGAVLARAIAGARVVRLPAAHLSNIEMPRSFAAALFDFLLPPADGSLDGGFAVRRAVLGEAYVDHAIADTTEFSRNFQALITQYAWGAVWARPGLDHRMRRLLALAMTAALGRWEEFRLHVRAGLAHGLESCDIEEGLLQVAVYAGVPAANAAFHIAAEEITARAPTADDNDPPSEQSSR